MLAVVHHEQALQPGEHVQFADRPPGGVDRESALGRHPTLEERPAAQPDRGEHGRADLGRFGDRGQVDQPGAVAELVPAAAGLDREAGLTRSARPDDGDEAPAGEQRVDPGEVVVAPDEAGQGGGQVARRVWDVRR
ncbi:hypothetical protein [Dactylosporangium cerinum]